MTRSAESEAELEAVHQKVREQSVKFEAELPALLLTNLGEYVVYLDRPLGFFPTMNKALAWAYENLGINGGFVAAKIEPQRTIFLPFWR